MEPIEKAFNEGDEVVLTWIVQKVVGEGVSRRITIRNDSTGQLCTVWPADIRRIQPGAGK